MSSIINILCATDDNYVPYCGTMLTSLFENNQTSKFNVFVLNEHLTEKNIQDMVSLAETYSQVIHFVTVTSDVLKDCPIRKKDHVTLATYYRLMAPVLLSQKIDKILYLDCDIIVDGSILDLWNENIDGFAIGGVVDESYLNLSYYERLQIDLHKKYFNAGVLLINLRYWREHDVMERCFSCISAMQEKLKLHDQDTLNVVLQNEVKLFPVKYNFQTGFLYIEKPLEVCVRKEVLDTLLAPIVIHFTGRRKPWLAHYYHPYVSRYRYYRSISLWKNTPLVMKFKEEWRYFRHQIKFALGMKKRPYVTDYM